MNQELIDASLLSSRTRQALGWLKRLWKKEPLGFIALLLTIAGGFYGLCEKFHPPTIEVLGVRPIYVRGSETHIIDGKAEEIPKRGISFIFHLKSGSRSVSIDREIGRANV